MLKRRFCLGKLLRNGVTGRQKPAGVLLLLGEAEEFEMINRNLLFAGRFTPAPRLPFDPRQKEAKTCPSPGRLYGSIKLAPNRV